MNISSIQNNWALYAAQSSYLNALNSNASQPSSNITDNSLSNADGDTLTISGNSQNVGSKYMMYGPAQSQNGLNGPGPAPNPEIKSFLDKVANGTATDADLKSMQSVLQQMQPQVSGTSTNGSDPNSTASDLTSFIAKVANGTATDADLKSMQSVLQQMQQQNSSGGTHRHHHHHSSESNSTNINSTGSDLQSFLDKVANGTATDTDLKNIQSELQNVQPQVSSASTNGTDSNSTASDFKSFLDKVASGTATDDDLKNIQSELQKVQPQVSSAGTNGTDSNSTASDLKSFLDKVASGTVTDADLKSMQSVLQQTQQQFGSGGTHTHGHHHHPSSESTSTNSSSTANLDTTSTNGTGSDLQSFLDKVSDGTATDNDLKNMQSSLQQMQQQLLNDFTYNNATL